MEPSRRRQLVRYGLSLGVVLAVVLLAAGTLSGDGRRERLAGHAFAIPSGENRIIAEVLNATERQGLARAVTRALRRRGVDVVYLGNAREHRDSTVVVVRRGELARGQKVADLLGVSAVVTEIDTLRRVDVSVLLGWDFELPEEMHP